MEHAREVKEVVTCFNIAGQLLDVSPYGSGHINDTYLSHFQEGYRIVRYIHQWINHQVFKEPEKVMENIERVTNYLRQQVIAAAGDPVREVLTLVPAQDGKSYYKSAQGNYWRSYIFIEGARTYDVVEDKQHLYSASKAYGNFQKLLSSLPGGRLHETIPNFHYTPHRYESFIRATEKDVMNRAQTVKSEIDLITGRVNDVSIVVDLIAKGLIPERVTHNDTKLNNVLIDEACGEGICVIDLDTVMPGSVLYDFGDSVRVGTTTAAEDEPDIGKVSLNLELFEYLVRGYLEAVSDFLAPAEIDYLAFSGRLITLEQAMRFLGDYLNGDVYYKTHRPQQNLDRARTQIKLVREMEKHFDAMDAIVNRYR